MMKRLFLAIICFLAVASETPAAEPVEMQAAAASGDVRMQMALAAALEAQERPDFVGALSWYRAAAEQGDAVASFQVAEYLYNGIAGPANPPEAIPWFERAVAAGYPPAEVEYSILLLDGKFIEQDFERARALVLKAADAGNRKALMLRKNLSIH